MIKPDFSRPFDFKHYIIKAENKNYEYFSVHKTTPYVYARIAVLYAYKIIFSHSSSVFYVSSIETENRNHANFKQSPSTRRTPNMNFIRENWWSLVAVYIQGYVTEGTWLLPLPNVHSVTKPVIWAQWNPGAKTRPSPDYVGLHLISPLNTHDRQFAYLRVRMSPQAKQQSHSADC